jgi:prophage antirepressor-like protein
MTDLIDAISKDGQYVFGKKNALSIFGTYENPLFLVNEVMKGLGILNNNSHRKLKNMPDTMKSKGRVKTSGGPQQVTLITESGLYWLIFRSNTEEAIVFSTWICEEVLPSIRKTGSYKLEKERIRLLKENERYYERILELEEIVDDDPYRMSIEDKRAEMAWTRDWLHRSSQPGYLPPCLRKLAS